MVDAVKGFLLMSRYVRHVVPRDGDWAVVGENSSRASNIYNTQREAIKRAEDLARRNHGETKIHNRQGQIRAGNSYGSDPCPPKDTK